MSLLIQGDRGIKKSTGYPGGGVLWVVCGHGVLGLRWGGDGVRKAWGHEVDGLIMEHFTHCMGLFLI